ncbi:MAG: peptide deformylase [Candidatus Gracilibacteria bacterium]|nr:peptide deformylase [Candidatus Gracilibacteria bacterium]
MLQVETGVNNEILREKSEEIKLSEIKKYEKLGNEMIKFIKDPKNGGVGLAAPQVGYNKRLIVVSLLKDWDDEDFKTIMMINPEIIEHSEATDIEEEGCLSVPGAKGKVRRYLNIKLKFLDGKGKEKLLRLQGLSARIVQHEIDHIDGVLFVDKLS